MLNIFKKPFDTLLGTAKTSNDDAEIFFFCCFDLPIQLEVKIGKPLSKSDENVPGF